MRTPSVKSTFDSWKKSTLFLIVVLILGALTVLQEHTSFGKIENLQNQKKLVDFITNIGRDDLEFAAIQYRGKSTMLHYEHDKLITLNQYDILGNYILGQSTHYEKDLEQLKVLALNFTDKADAWYEPDAKDLEQRKEDMLDARFALLSHINKMIEINNAYELEKFKIQEGIIYFALLLLVMTFLMNLKRFHVIQKDIESLYVVEPGAEPHQITNEEIDIISKRMSRKQPTTDNPALIDPITEINNYKGLLHSYANKKGGKDAAFVGVCLFEIDNFNDLDKRYPKSFTQSILKRTAFNLHVYEQPTDIVARTDYNQFAFVFMRKTREAALKECKDIMQSFAEAKFKVPQGETLQLTLSAGFAPKIGGSTLEEMIEQAGKVLEVSKGEAPGTFLETKDIIK